MADPGSRFLETTRRAGSIADSGPSRRCATCGAQYPLDFVVCPKDATALSKPEVADEDPLVGEVLAGTFCITGIIGEGGMGKVYEAEHVRLPKRFAIKVMQEELLKHPEALARFEREAQAVARVASEHVIEVVDVVRLKDGRPCLVSELLEGQELGDLLDQEGKIPLGTAIAIGRQVCRGLAAAHAVGIIHRDLKPSNLFMMRRSDGRPFVKILDFGVAKLNDGAELTRTGMIVGTPAYMAPEQARGSSSIDERADVYSVGAVLYRLLTGSPPFIGDDPALILTRLLTEDPQRPRDLNRSIPDGMEHLIQRAMARAPEDRPKSVIELERELAFFDEGMREPAHEAPKPLQAIGTMDTVVELSSRPSAAMTASKRGRWARSSAIIFAVIAGIIAGSASLATTAAALRAFAGKAALGDTEVLLLIVMSGIGTLIALVSAMRALASRWRSAPAVDRLATGLKSAIVAVLATSGALAIGWTDYITVGLPADPDMLPFINLALVLLPTLVGMIVFIGALRRASKVL
jgi:tRNA A-37 threonylcarbamoyl transferase component Bud32